MKIIRFSAENVKKLRAVQIEPNGSVVEIVGHNGSGKSSVLDAIFYALRGAAEIPSQVVRQGEEKAFVKLELGDEAPGVSIVELVVTRYFTKDGATRLTIESRDGAVFKSPQAMLDKLVGALSFDPLAFTRMDAKAQLATLRSLVILAEDVDQLQAQVTVDHEVRNRLNREMKSLQAQHALKLIPRLTPESEVPDEPIDTTAIMFEMRQASENNQARQAELFRRQREAETIEAYRLRGADLEKSALDVISAATERCRTIMAEAAHNERELFEQRDNILKQAQEKHDALFACEPLPEAVNFEELQSKYTVADNVNKAVVIKKQRQELEAQITELQNKIDARNENIELLNQRRTKAITEAVMPVEGLAFGNGEVLYNSLPLVQASAAEQLRVSVAIAIATNPKLKVLRVKDGSLLDEQSMTELNTLVHGAGYQLWIERVDTYGCSVPTVIMEDGSAKNPSEGGYLIPPLEESGQ